MEFTIVPLVSGLVAGLVMTLFLRRARFFHLPETQMIRAIGSFVTKDFESARNPGFFIHVAASIVFAYAYAFILTTAPTAGKGPLVLIFACTLMGLVHGLVVTLFLVIAVAQYHPLEVFRKLGPEDKAAHVIAHIAYGATLGLGFAYLPGLFS